MRLAISAGFCALLVGSTAAWAKDDEDGIPVTVQVLDAETQAPISTAVVRNPQEEERHRVNRELGTWVGTRFYMPDGTEVKFTKGATLQFEVSAPGYVNQIVGYTVRKRRNEFPVYLQKMEVDLTEENPDDVMIQFGRDKPID
jgi:hypothetical protein